MFQMLKVDSNVKILVLGNSTNSYDLSICRSVKSYIATYAVLLVNLR